MSNPLDRFTVLQRLGAGGMAEVFKCRQTGVGGFEKVVVLKRILPHLVQESAFISMFLDEARIAASLSHPNIVQTFEIITDPSGVPYIVMEFVNGPSLADLVKEARAENTLDLRHLVRLHEGVARGLHHAHHATDAQGKPLHIIHRDLSPHNVLVTLDGIAKLADFGVARAEGRLTHTRSGVVKGKVRYTAPEMLMDPENTCDPRTDVFSLGVCLYSATTGQLPFNGATDLQVMEAVRHGVYPAPSSLVPGYPPGLERVVGWMLQHEPAARCPSGEAAAGALRAWLSETSGSTDAELASWVHAVSQRFLSRVVPPPPPDALSKRNDPAVTGVLAPREEPEEIDILITDAGPSLGTSRSSHRFGAFALAFMLLLGGGSAALAVRQVNAHRDATRARGAFLEEARLELSSGRFHRVEELLELADDVPEPTAQDELTIAKLRGDLRYERSVAAAHAAIEAGDLDAASALLKTVLSLEATDERSQRLLQELHAIETAAARRERPEVLDAGAPAVAASQKTPPRQGKKTTMVARVSTTLADTASAATGPEAPSDAPPAPEEAQPPAAVMPDEPVVAPPPVARPRVHVGVTRRAKEGGPLLRVTANVRAQVFLDGLPIGFTPLDVPNVGPSTHLVMAWAEGYESVTERVAVAPSEAVSLDFPLARSP